jgi:hypothetical protein
MASDNLLRRNMQRTKRSFKRSKNTRESYDVVLIVCEGEKTEPNYLKGICSEYQLNSANITVLGIGADPLSIANYALKEFDRNKDYDRVYCVFDKDQHPSYQIALEKIDSSRNKKANKIPIYAITSVPCFEYWLLLHFIESTRPYARAGSKSAGDQLLSSIKEYMPEYNKGYVNIYEITKDKINIAIERAKKIDVQQEKNGTDNPSTKFYQLVEYLRNLKKINCEK